MRNEHSLNCPKNVNFTQISNEAITYNVQLEKSHNKMLNQYIHSQILHEHLPSGTQHLLHGIERTIN